MVRARVRYGRVADFLADARQQLSRGGLLVRVVTDGLDRGAEVELTVATPVGTREVTGHVLQVLSDAGFAVGFDAAPFEDIIAAAEVWSGEDQGEPPLHELAVGRELSVPPGAPPAPSQGAAQAAKIQQALHGDKNQRAAILRDNNKLLHSYVLRNPQIGLDEVVAIARMATIAVDVINFITSRREWIERPEVAAALVRNPKTPVPLAIRLLDHVGQGELRQLAKQSTVRDAISRAARKKILG